MIEFEKTDSMFPGKGQWSRRVTNGKTTAEIGCPQCGNFGSLQNHEIAADGKIDPSIVCPWTPENGCTFHDWGRLKDWKG